VSNSRFRKEPRILSRRFSNSLRRVSWSRTAVMPLDEPERQMLKKLLNMLRQNADENMAPNKTNREES